MSFQHITQWSVLEFTLPKKKKNPKIKEGRFLNLHASKQEQHVYSRHQSSHVTITNVSQTSKNSQILGIDRSKVHFPGIVLKALNFQLDYNTFPIFSFDENSEQARMTSVFSQFQLRRHFWTIQPHQSQIRRYRDVKHHFNNISSNFGVNLAIIKATDIPFPYVIYFCDPIWPSRKMSLSHNATPEICVLDLPPNSKWRCCMGSEKLITLQWSNRTSLSLKPLFCALGNMHQSFFS